MACSNALAYKRFLYVTFAAITGVGPLRITGPDYRIPASGGPMIQGKAFLERDGLANYATDSPTLLFGEL